MKHFHNWLFLASRVTGIHALGYFEHYEDVSVVPAYKVPENLSIPAIPLLDAQGKLVERQEPSTPEACYAINYGWCANIPKCCPLNWQCCPYGCGGPMPEYGDCCSTGQCEGYRPRCCNNKWCITDQDECCLNNYYCPSPFKCILFNGQDACCTDLSCTVYLSGTVTKTRGATALATTTRRTTTAYVATPTEEIITSSFTTGYILTLYETTIYWSYWYYFYTVYYSPSTYTSRIRTTITSTASFSCSATDRYEADSTFSASSRDLPTPASAEEYIPPTPTVGAIVIGPCVTETTGETTTSTCQTARAVSADASGSSDSGSGGGSGSSGSSSGGSTSGARLIDLLPAVMLAIMSACAVLMLIL